MGRNAVSSNELFIDDLRVPVCDRIGDEGKGFSYILHGLNPERMLIAPRPSASAVLRWTVQ
jgi:acyl-CoA dehydrogenase